VFVKFLLCFALLKTQGTIILYFISVLNSTFFIGVSMVMHESALKKSYVKKTAGIIMLMTARGFRVASLFKTQRRHTVVNVNQKQNYFRKSYFLQ
jgi:hypothetical protein